jgi:hypothetical protein
MSTPRKRVEDKPPRTEKPGAGRLPKRHPVPTLRGEKHLGATEAQMSVTMPPSPDDDEPKQG